jgi:hypothetical protein
MAFLKEWKDTKKMKYFQALITMSFVILFMGIYINVPEESLRANIYQIMLIWTGICAGIDAVTEGHWLFAWAGFGDFKRFITSFTTGAVIMLIAFNLHALSIAAPLAVISVSALQFIYTVLAAPYIEEKFFRQFTLYTSYQVFRGVGIPFSDIFAILFNSVVFAIFHGFAFSWELNGLIMAFIFGIVACVGNQIFKSGGFSFGAHFMNNLLVYTGWRVF